MRSSQLPVVPSGASLGQALEVLNAGRLGCVCVLDRGASAGPSDRWRCAPSRLRESAGHGRRGGLRHDRPPCTPFPGNRPPKCLTSWSPGPSPCCPWSPRTGPWPAWCTCTTCWARAGSNFPVPESRDASFQTHFSHEYERYTSMIHPDVCSRCAARGRTCCTVSSGDEEFCFPISISEMEAIRSAGQGGEDCFALAPNTPVSSSSSVNSCRRQTSKGRFSRAGLPLAIGHDRAGRLRLSEPCGMLFLSAACGRFIAAFFRSGCFTGS
jgi:hypothetical protein